MAHYPVFLKYESRQVLIMYSFGAAEDMTQWHYYTSTAPISSVLECQSLAKVDKSNEVAALSTQDSPGLFEYFAGSQRHNT